MIQLTAEMLEGFSNSILAKRFDGRVATPECHKEWWNLCCSSEQYVAISAPRG